MFVSTVPDVKSMLAALLCKCVRT